MNIILPPSELDEEKWHHDRCLPAQIWNVIYTGFLEQSGNIPQIWCIGIIIPVPKSGDKSRTDNYQGITLLPAVVKIFLTILSNRIYEWAELNTIIPREQFGFRVEHRTVDAIFIPNALIESKLRSQKKRYCCFVDLRKAFDSVDHQLLWHKLTQLSLSSKLLRLLMNIYSKGQSCIKVNVQLTNTAILMFGKVFQSCLTMCCTPMI